MGSIHLTSPSATSSMASKGTLNYKIKYVSDPAVQKLHVTVVSASIPKKGLGKSDPYVRVYLMPGTHMELKTKMISNNQNPVFNDEFSFVLKPDDVRRKTIVFQVFDKDTFSKDDGIGEVQVPLWNIADLESETMNTMQLMEITKDANNKPKLLARRPDASKSFSSSRSSTIERHHASESRQSYAGQTGYQHYEQSSFSQQYGSGYNTGAIAGSTRTSTTTRQDSSSSSSDEETVMRRTVSGGQGGLSLHELNNRLEKYIRQINLNPDTPNVSIAVDRISEGGNFDISSMPQFLEYERMMREYQEQEEHLARVDAEIDILKHENTDYEDRLRGIESKISSKKSEILELESKIQKFENDKRIAESEVTESMVHNARVSAMKEKAGFMERLKSIHWESVTVTEEMQNESEIREEIRAEYTRRLKEEIEKIKYLYTSYEQGMNESIKSIFDAKIAELNRLRQNWSADEQAEVNAILARLEAGKNQIIELEKRKLDLSHEERRLGENLEEKELHYKTMLDARMREKAWLEEQYQQLYMEYSKYETDHSGFDREVERYSRILQRDETKRVSVHAERFYDSTKREDDSSSSSSSSDDDDTFQKHH